MECRCIPQPEDKECQPRRSCPGSPSCLLHRRAPRTGHVWSPPPKAASPVTPGNTIVRLWAFGPYLSWITLLCVARRVWSNSCCVIDTYRAPFGEKRGGRSLDHLWCHLCYYFRKRFSQKSVQTVQEINSFVEVIWEKYTDSAQLIWQIK